MGVRLGDFVLQGYVSAKTKGKENSLISGECFSERRVSKENRGFPVWLCRVHWQGSEK